VGANFNDEMLLIRAENHVPNVFLEIAGRWAIYRRRPFCRRGFFFSLSGSPGLIDIRPSASCPFPLLEDGFVLVGRKGGEFVHPPGAENFVDCFPG